VKLFNTGRKSGSEKIKVENNENKKLVNILIQASFLVNIMFIII